MTERRPADERFADFGFEKVKEGEKTRRVKAVFDSVAGRYDLMNDLMSFGLHRVWKRLAVMAAMVRPGFRILDLAGGTGDLARLFAQRVGKTGQVVISDINGEMLNIGRDRLLDRGVGDNVSIVQTNAEALPFPSQTFDIVSIAFGLRNVTNKNSALEEMYRILRPGGRALVLEFSELKIPILRGAYDAFSFRVLPKLGEWVAKDGESYRYLAESIRVHPNQEELLSMMLAAGFERCRCRNMAGGIVALHDGVRL
ncbi:MAG: bifunctional demethylmenaquinone methyltransferase/2-methoxy-6-polyprenyl-1,4-benzoquinol methylase UbiE [Gammaproteobacteria bacterium]|jgi:demethylmenaquinone methyltransferase/2-methoxy-6-polyprenyl-1,4-benzoquinol methylase|nr:bifunctional demethylmenaquinone methyltransferase/2-methoxy-6-polyprenyl-1,4-benzoquinol methylase UbiE [Gammaproteobacteria bacterium]